MPDWSKLSKKSRMNRIRIKSNFQVGCGRLCYNYNQIIISYLSSTDYDPPTHHQPPQEPPGIRANSTVIKRNLFLVILIALVVSIATFLKASPKLLNGS